MSYNIFGKVLSVISVIRLLLKISHIELFSALISTYGIIAN